MLTQNGADVNAVQEDKRTALHFASKNGYVDVVQVLLQNGADVNAVAVNNWTALHYAVQEAHADVTKVLIQNGADVNAVWKKVPLHYAAQHGYVDVAKVLLQNGAFVDADVDGVTPLTLVNGKIHKISRALTLLLLCCGARIRDKNISEDPTGLLNPIHEVLGMYRDGYLYDRNILYSKEERMFMWNLSFVLALKHRSIAFKVFYTVRSFITFNELFMAPGYELGEDSIYHNRNSDELRTKVLSIKACCLKNGGG